MSSYFHVTRRLPTILFLGWSLALSAEANAANPPGAKKQVDCPPESWRTVLDLGLLANRKSEKQLLDWKLRGDCLGISKLAETLLEDRKSPIDSRTSPIPLWIPNPDWARLNLRDKAIGRAVLVKVSIDVQGRVSNVELMRANGDARIDAICVETARTWLFRPALGTAGYVSSEKLFTIDIEVR